MGKWMGSHRGCIAKAPGTPENSAEKEEIVLDHILLIGRKLLALHALELASGVRGNF